MFPFTTVYEYAGPTLLARTAATTGCVVLAALAATLAILCVRAVRRGLSWRRFSAVHATALLALAYLALWLAAGPALDHAWWYLQENVRRSYSTYRALTWATALLPPRGEKGRGTFVHLATRDTGFAKGQPRRVERAEGHETAYYLDEDYGEVVTLDDRPLVTGTRYAATRKLVSLVPLFEVPRARRALVVGAESGFYADELKLAGIEVATAPSLSAGAEGVFDLALVCPEPEWICGSERPDAMLWARLVAKIDRAFGAVALHLDARLLPASRAKRLLEDFRGAFGAVRVWCVGRYDWVLVGFAWQEQPPRFADDAVALFSREDVFDAFLDAGVCGVGDVFANYVGTFEEVMPALDGIASMGRREGLAAAPSLAFEPPPRDERAQLAPGDLLPLKDAGVEWFRRGECETEVFDSLTNRIADVQWARRTVLDGIVDADAGRGDAAIEKWSGAAMVNPHDPILKAVADSLDLEGRRRLRVGDNNGAMRCYENRILVDPDNVAAVHNFGVCLKKAGRADVAVQVFQRAAAMDPRGDEHRLEIVECASAAGNDELALRELEELIARHPGDVALKQRRAKILVHGFVKETEAKKKEQEK